MVERIKWTMSHYNLTAAQFADQIGVQRSAVSHVLSGRNNPSLDFMIKIKKAFPAINFEWLTLGNGKPVADGTISSSEHFSEASRGTLADYDKEKHQPELDFVPHEPVVDKEDVSVTNGSEMQKSALNQVVKEVIRVVLLYSDGSFESYETGK